MRQPNSGQFKGRASAAAAAKEAVVFRAQTTSQNQRAVSNCAYQDRFIRDRSRITMAQTTANATQQLVGQQMPRIFRSTAIITFAAMVTVYIQAQAHQMLYDQEGYRLAVGIEAGLGGFAVGNVDTGAGNVNTDAPLEAPFPPEERRATRDWFEGFVKPFAEVETPFFEFGHTYALVSFVEALTRGNGDATSS